MRKDQNLDCLALLIALLIVVPSHGAVASEIEGQHGELYVHGALLASPCGLAMDSAAQEVWLGEVGTAALQQPGDRGGPVSFTLRLTGCSAGPAFAADELRGTRTWSREQPKITVNFSADTDPDAPALARVSGVSGLALALEDARGERVSLNERSRPVLVSSGNSDLTYTVTPVRTPAALTPGDWRAVIGFGVRYD